MPPMSSSRQILDQQFIEMRSRCLSLAADLDRVQRGEGGEAVLKSDVRLQKFREAIGIVLENSPAPARAERVLEVFSDKTTVPTK